MSAEIAGLVRVRCVACTQHSYVPLCMRMSVVLSKISLSGANPRCTIIRTLGLLASIVPTATLKISFDFSLFSFNVFSNSVFQVAVAVFDMLMADKKSVMEEGVQQRVVCYCKNTLLKHTFLFLTIQSSHLITPPCR